jgi:hypothetical protein
MQYQNTRTGTLSRECFSNSVNLLNHFSVQEEEPMEHFSEGVQVRYESCTRIQPLPYKDRWGRLIEPKFCRIEVTKPGFGRRHLRSSFNLKVFLGPHRGREGEKGRTELEFLNSIWGP